MIKVEKLCKSYGKAEVLKNISVQFDDGKIHGIIGRNGSGKTVLLKCICGLVSYNSGNIMIDDFSVNVDNPPIGKIGALIENPGYLGNLDAEKNLKILCDLLGTDCRRVSEVLDLLGLRGEKKRLSQYSLGMKQRFGIAQAILDDAPYIIMDEPMNSLDDESVVKVRKILKELRGKGKTILIASHIKEDIEELCDTVISLHMGEIKEKIKDN